MDEEYINEYIFSGSLPENASTYVTREADDELYEALRQGKFCYVLNSRQSGKSSLRVRTMSRLSEAGVECASIDLSSVNIQSATQENWYADLIMKLIDSFDLHVDFQQWWQKYQLNSTLLRFGNFLEKILLTEIQEKIVIFIDEIDSVLSLKFPTDDFFAFIRSCYNQRVDNPDFNRLTFCLLGVASPSDLIKDKQRTPFNIGKAISLKGFQLYEVEPLQRGLEEKFSNPQAVMQEILEWTGGQPFLTQKLCQFMVEESEKENSRSVEQIVKSRIIENWESQDEPEHLRTIQARILRDEQRAGYLLELYQQIRLMEEKSEITADDTLEQSELQLSGLIVRQQNKLRVYNPIYKEVFEQNWIENQLNNLRPYSETFRFWVASEGTDDSRLLRGKALHDALEWSKDKSLNYEDRQFLAASQAKEREDKIAALEKEAELQRERKDREAAEKRNQVLKDSAEYVETVGELVRLAVQLQDEGSSSVAEELFSQAGQSVKITDQKLKQAVLYAGISYAYQKLRAIKEDDKKKNLELADEYFKKVQVSNENSSEGLQINILKLRIQAKLFNEQGYTKEAIKTYTEAFNILKTHKISPFNQKLLVKIISKKNVEAVHRELITLLSDGGDVEFNKNVKESLTEHYYNELDNFLANKNWKEADQKTYQMMLFIADRESEGYLDDESINKISCPSLKIIDDLWKKHSNGRFGFGVQNQIWRKTTNRLGTRERVISAENEKAALSFFSNENEKAALSFFSKLGWYNSSTKRLKSYNSVIETVEKDYNTAPRGVLPFILQEVVAYDQISKMELENHGVGVDYDSVGFAYRFALYIFKSFLCGFVYVITFLLRLVNCNI